MRLATAEAARNSVEQQQQQLQSKDTELAELKARLAQQETVLQQQLDSHTEQQVQQKVEQAVSAARLEWLKRLPEAEQVGSAGYCVMNTGDWVLAGWWCGPGEPGGAGAGQGPGGEQSGGVRGPAGGGGPAAAGQSGGGGQAQQKGRGCSHSGNQVGKLTLLKNFKIKPGDRGKTERLH